MKTAIAFMKKEMLEYVRSGKIYILLAIFVIVGILNPGTALLTPWLMENLQSSDSGMVITMTNEISAMDSWAQFFKNLPIAMIAFVLITGGTVTTEIQRGTLIPVFTKGMSRFTVLLSKAVILIGIWSIGYWLCFGITYVYSDLYWDNSVAKNIGFAAFCSWLFGVMLIAAMAFFSSFISSFGGVIISVGGCVFVQTLISLVPKTVKYLPYKLMNAFGLLSIEKPGDYTIAVIVTLVVSVVCLAMGCIIFNKREV